MIRKTTALVAALLILTVAPAISAAETYTVDATHSSVGFKVRHLISKTAGRFNDFAGTISIDKDNLAASSVALTIDAASIDTDNEKRDGHLKSADFFDVETHPEITFKSTKIVKTSENMFDVTGDFTMRGVTKSITIPVEMLGFMPDMGLAGFETHFEINRKDYGVEWNRTLEAGGLLLGEDVEVNITIEAGAKRDK